MNTSNPRQHDIEAWLQVIRSTLQASLTCCPNCMHFEPVREVCEAARRAGAVDARPPAKTIAFGCKRFEALPPF